MKGYRKIIIFFVSLVWASAIGFVLKDYPAILVPVLSFAGTMGGFFFAANYGEHREENRNV